MSSGMAHETLRKEVSVSKVIVVRINYKTEIPLVLRVALQLNVEI